VQPDLQGYKAELLTVNYSNVGQGASEASFLTIPLSGVTRRLSGNACYAT